MLQLSKDISLPLDAVTQTFGILAVRGAGKSNTAAVMAEQMFAHKLPFVVVDPVGAWWGLRSSADGQGPGLAVPVFGGRHGDVPLEKTAGNMIADLVVDERLSCVLDCSEFSEGDKIRFLIDFSERLYRRNQDPLHLFLEEADDYCPQRPFREQARLLRNWENVVRRGRARGLGITMITQRSAALNKNVLTQIETLIVLRTTAPNDRKAIAAWVEYHGQGAELLASLPELGAGEAWVWSPAWLKSLKRVQMNRRATFDSGATPKDLKGKRPPANLADVDLAAITKKMQATIERAKSEDPRELHRRIAELERALRERPAASPPEPVEILVPLISAKDFEQLGLMQDMIEKRGHEIARDAEQILATAKLVSEQLASLKSAVAEFKPMVSQNPPSSPFSKGGKRGISNGAAVSSWPKPLHVTSTEPAKWEDLDGVSLRVLRAVHSLRERNLPVNRPAVARWMGIHPNGGRFNAALKSLKDKGQLAADLHPTSSTPTVAPIAPHGPDGVLDLLDQGKKRIFEEILQHGGISREDLAEKLGVHPNGGRFNSNLKWLREMGVIPDRGPIKALEGVFR